MFTTVTVRMEAESKGELVDSMASQVDNCRKHYDALKGEGVFGPPEQVEMRYLIIGSTWRGPVEKPTEPTDINEDVND